MASKICTECAKTKPYHDFYKRDRHKIYPDSAAGFSTKCRTCVKTERKQYVELHPERTKEANDNSRLQRTYGISLTEYNAMFSSQKGCCLGCERHQSDLKFKLAVDHCHATGLVRGLLCITCNLTLGYVQDNPKILTNLQSYLTNSTVLAANTNILAFKSVTKVG